MPSASELSPPPAHVVAPGTLIAERYRVEAMLGEGGMGIVYLAEHVHMRKRVAIKVLLPQWTRTPEVVARFEREAVAAGAIAHPNVAAATDFGRLADGSFFLVLEYLEGRTLRTELAAGALAPARALTIARGIAVGVAAAHAKGIVHRDLKPENVMLVARDGDPDFVKVLDFGIARVGARVATDGQVLTSAGAILGTPDYMAPEQALGGTIDARADLYALGVMLFEMLTGGCPFSGGAVTLMRQHILTPTPPLPAAVAHSLAPEVRELVARLLEKEASARYANAAELLPVLERCIAAMTPAAPAPAAATRPLELATRSARWLRRSLTQGLVNALALSRRRPKLALAGAVVVSVFVVTATAWSGGGTSAATTVSTASVPVGQAPPATPHGTASAAPATNGVASSSPSASASAAPAGSARDRHAGRHTGPGGIYIPPPNRWFK